jgi:aspartyl-tRNA(Asn)/glutamyl-tRNA(Gln) amidotransferase subunit B
MNLSFENHSSEKTNSEKLTTIKIGLEIHAYINTKSKLFCSCPSEADIEDKSPNSNCCPICLGHPGSKPVLNEKAVELGALIGLALNCSLNKEFFFSRKTYFYPDMASNYQITQYETPIAKKGFVMLGEKKN